MAEALIRTEALVKDYHLGSRKIHALRGVSVAIRPAEFVAVRGPSGSGKSTFMNLLGCLDTPTSGRYHLDGLDVSRMGGDALARVRNEKIGFVVQTFKPPPRPRPVSRGGTCRCSTARRCPGTGRPAPGPSWPQSASPSASITIPRSC